MTVPPDFQPPELRSETAEGSSYDTGNKVFTYHAEENDTWTETNAPADQTVRLTLEERLAAIEAALNL